MPYQILAELGEGSFGVVYLLKLPNWREYALKVIQILEPDESDLAQRESELMLELEHPHILQCYWVGMHRQQLLFLLLEYCERGTLTNAIKKSVSEEQALTWFIQMADALKYLHSKKVMHRDIKPDNILLDKNNDIKVGDLGIARMQEFTSQGGGTCAGTICYMSPQILQEQNYKDKTDVWSLGCVFHEVLSKRPPFSYTNVYAIINGPQLQSRPYYPRQNIRHQKEMLDTQGVFNALQLYRRSKQPEVQTTESSNSSISGWLLAGAAAVGLAAAAALIASSSEQSKESDKKKPKN